MITHPVSISHAATHSLGKRPIAVVLALRGLDFFLRTLGTVAAPLLGVVPVQLVNPARVGEADEKGDEKELEDVDDHTPEGDLERTQMGVDGEDVDQLEGTEDVGGCEKTL